MKKIELSKLNITKIFHTNKVSQASEATQQFGIKAGEGMKPLEEDALNVLKPSVRSFRKEMKDFLSFCINPVKFIKAEKAKVVELEKKLRILDSYVDGIHDSAKDLNEIIGRQQKL